MSSASTEIVILVVPRRGCIVREVVQSTDTDALSAFEWLHCPCCNGHHYDYDDGACDEYATLVEHFDDADNSWWLENRRDDAHWHDSTPCWSNCAATHSHPCMGGCGMADDDVHGHGKHEEPCFDSDCRRCPVCAGRMDHCEWSGIACSRACARVYSNDR